MKLNKALKVKNRLVGQLNNLQEILRRENSRRNDNPSTVDCSLTDKEIDLVTTKLTNIKTAIAVANVGLYGTLEKMSEIKNQIAFLRSLPVREGEELTLFGRNQEKLVYTWTAYRNQENVDMAVSRLQTEIDKLQDQVDHYNATTEVTFEE